MERAAVIFIIIKKFKNINFGGHVFMCLLTMMTLPHYLVVSGVV